MENDYDDYAPRRRRRYEDDYDDDRDYPRPEERSGLVIGLAVVNFLMGALILMVALICLFAGFMMTVEGRGRDRDEAYIPFSIGFITFLLGVGYIVSGIGLISRRHWGRIMCLIIGAFDFLVAAGGLLGMVAIIANNRRMREEAVVGLMFSCFGVLLFLGHGLFAYLTLLRARIVAEFK